MAHDGSLRALLYKIRTLRLVGFEPGSGACGTKGFTTAPEGHCFYVNKVDFIVGFT